MSLIRGRALLRPLLFFRFEIAATECPFNLVGLLLKALSVSSHSIALCTPQRGLIASSYIFCCSASHMQALSVSSHSVDVCSPS